VALTTLTLWSLGQAIVVAPPDAPAAMIVANSPVPALPGTTIVDSTVWPTGG